MSEIPHHHASEDVRRYYDRNTSSFLRFGGSGEIAAIHRQIWAPEVKDAAQAFLFVNRLVANAVKPVLPSAGGRIIDLGCGAGGVSTWLAQELNATVVGVTNSTVQRRIAAQRAQAMGLAGRCQFIEADFLQLPDLGSFHAACAIESFIHASDAACFFQQAANQLRPGGILLVCDDFLAESGNPGMESAQACYWLRRFRQGWHAYSLVPFSAANRLAEQTGLRLLETRNLSRHIRSFKPLLLGLMKALTHLPLRSASWQNLSGGTALQECLKQGWTEYRSATWVFQPS